jgi:hypothetical protein
MLGESSNGLHKHHDHTTQYFDDEWRSPQVGTTLAKNGLQSSHGALRRRR